MSQDYSDPNPKFLLSHVWSIYQIIFNGGTSLSLDNIFGFCKKLQNIWAQVS